VVGEGDVVVEVVVAGALDMSATLVASRRLESDTSSTSTDNGSPHVHGAGEDNDQVNVDGIVIEPVYGAAGIVATAGQALRS